MHVYMEHIENISVFMEKRKFIKLQRRSEERETKGEGAATQ